MICLELLFMESLMCDYNNNSYIYDKNWSGNFWGENFATRQVCRMCTPVDKIAFFIEKCPYILETGDKKYV